MWRKSVVLILLVTIHLVASQVLQPHPLDPLSGPEIARASQIVRISNPGVDWMFVWVTLKEPEKFILLPYFLNDTDYPPNGSVPRKVLIIALHPQTAVTYEGIVNLDMDIVESWIGVDGVDPTFAADEMDYIADLVLEEPLILERLSLYGPFYGNKSNVITDVWKYGYTKDKPEYFGKRIAQVFFYGKNFEFDNFYAHPMGFVAIVDTLSKQLLKIEELPIHEDFDGVDREGDEVPPQTGNYDPTVTGKWYRDDVSSIDISQENGPSFTLDGNLLRWQKFKLRIGHNGREGLILHNVNYNDSGTIRPLLYRLSLSELFVPYGDPRPPYTRKMALDVGEYGLGFSASELRSPDGCRGSVYFMDAVYNDMAGQPNRIKNAFCVYEEDAGILWRKMDPVTKRIVTARSQRLVLTFIATVANYDYQIKWMFYQDASFRGELVLTGIVSQNLLGTEATPAGHGTIIMPNVNAQYHQHFFTVRLDTEFDGNKNTVSMLDIVQDMEPPGSPLNPYGNGFHVNETTLRTSGQARTRANPDSARTWKISAEAGNLNPISGTSKAWKLIPDHVARLMIQKDSVLYPKCAFVDYDVWVTPYKEDQLFAGGFYLDEVGLPSWVGEEPEANVEDTDIVLWHVFGLTHVTRLEDGPVMPIESIGFWLKPANFFTENPGLDVLPIVRDSE